jgi:O-acetylhomoserine (thiol)-lyase
MPIYSNASFEFETAEQMERAFLGRSPDHAYSRISNPTVENFEQRIRSITGALSVTALSSGMAAISNAILTLASVGSNLVTSKHLFGNTYVFFQNNLSVYGVEIRYCDLTDIKEVREAIDGNTMALFFETITNPQLEVADIRKLSEVARTVNVPLIADTTITPANIFRASDFGIDIEVVSSTKIISGGANSIGGLIIDYGRFDWSFSKMLKSWAARFGPMAFNAKLRKEVFRNLGSCMSPFTAYLQSLGLETVRLRFDRAAENCLELANFLKDSPDIQKVNYPGLKDSAFYDISKIQFGAYPGALLTFSLSSKENAFKFINNLRIIKRSSNLYDNKTLIIHPASTIFSDVDPAVRSSIGVDDTLIRLSVGIEDIGDLKEDISSSLSQL